MIKIHWIALFSCLLTINVCSAEYPDRPIKLIVPTAPGGINDIVARLIQPGLSNTLKQPIIVENKPGANNIIGTEYVAKSPPDGYTLVIVPGSHSVNSAVKKKMPFDAEKDLTPVILIGKNPMFFLINPKVPAKNLKEFSALIKASPGKYSFATPGIASQADLIASQWANLTDTEFSKIPYKGGAPALLATISGETQFTVISSLLAATHVESGKLKALAIGSNQRDRLFPNIPTTSESGYPALEAITWVGIFAPTGTPRSIISKLNTVINQLIQEPEMASILAKQGVSTDGGAPELLSQLVNNEITHWKVIAQKNNISEP